MRKISRRDFLKTAACGAACVAGASLGMIGTANAEQAEEIKWDAEYDVVVIGMGFAGSAAAVQAADTGARVLLTEKAPEGAQGGNSRISGQYIQATDDKDAQYTYLKALLGDYPNYDDDVLKALVEGEYNQFDWLVNTLGADSKILLQDEPWSTTYSSAYETTHFDGGRKGYVQHWPEFPELEGADHCLSFLVSGKGFDSSLYTLFKENIAKRENIETWFKAPGQHLILNTQGEVIGAQIEKDGELKNVHALGGVVLACGGFEANPDMMANFMQRIHVNNYGCAYNTGDGVRMGMEAAADLWHMSNGAAYMWGYIREGMNVCMWPPVGTSKGILVGPSGKRYVNEAAESRHGRISIGGEFLIRQTPDPTYYVMDSALAAQYKFQATFSTGNEKEIASGVVVKGDTLKELAEKIGVNPDNLKNTVERYNADFDAGRDADYDRPIASMPGKIAQAPFYALHVVASLLNTQGGPRRNCHAQVMSAKNAPVPGLFSAGELGAMWPDNYNGGGNIGECCVYGRIAGANAAKRAKGEF